MNLKIVRFCAGEVQRQGRDAIAVGDMCAAWEYALEEYARHRNSGVFHPSLVNVIRFGHLIEPEALNRPNGFRNVDVGIQAHDGRFIPCPPTSEVEGRMIRWFQFLQDGMMTPEETYKEFEVIHPFADGNGRVGKIIFNWMKRTLHDPIMPPDFFGGIANP